MTILKSFPSWNILGKQPSCSVTTDKNLWLSSSKTSSKLAPSLIGNDNRVARFETKEIKIGTLLGEGHFCEVYEVTSIKLSKRATKNLSDNQEEIDIRKSKKEACSGKKNGAKYAIKYLKESTCEGKEKKLATLDITKEARLLTLCNHENIVKIHGVSSRDTTCAMELFILMDRLQYTLSGKIESWKILDKPNRQRNGKELIEQKTLLALQVAEALAYLHTKRIVYRDLKPENIGFIDSENIRLFDFGLSRQLPASCSEKDPNAEFYRMSFAGSPMYMAPEVFLRKYNTKADVYAWAVVFYEMLSLEKPYSEANDYETHKIGICEFGVRPDLKGISGLTMQIKSILQNSWCQHIERRLTMENVCIELRKVINDTLEAKVDAGMMPIVHKPKCLVGAAA